jgi:tetratricopeptide (TPR) repeat protein
VNNPGTNVFSYALRVCGNTLKKSYRATRRWVSAHKKTSIAIGIILVALIAWLIVFLISRPFYSEKVQLTQIGLEYQQKLPGLKDSVRENPDDMEARKNYAVALYATGNLEEARDQYEEAVKLNDKDAVALNNLANTYRDLDQTDKSIEFYKKAIQASPKSLNAYSNLANVQLYSKNNPQDAIATYKTGLKQLPDNIQLLQLLAVAYEQTNEKGNARTTYQEILSIDSENTAAKAAMSRL